MLLAVRFATFELKLDGLIRSLEQRYRPDQPRVPAGQPEGGQWTSTAGRKICVA
jgi:hypothetical protein